MQMPDINKKMESALIPMELAARLRRASEEKKISKSDIIQLSLSHELANVVARARAGFRASSRRLRDAHRTESTTEKERSTT